MRWIEKEVRGSQLIFYIITCLGLQVAYIYAALGVFSLLHIQLPLAPEDRTFSLSWFTSLLLLAVALVEEIFFRLPLIIPIKRGWPLKKILTSAAALSAVFGYLHGDLHFIFLQGVWGFIISLLFLKCGALQKKYAKAFFVTIITHLLYNGIMLAINLTDRAASS